MKQKIKVTIDRSKWRTGVFSEFASGRGDTYLLNSEGFMCCLGFCSLAVGVPESEILNQPTPQSLCSRKEKIIRGLDPFVCPLRDDFQYTFCGTELSIDAMKINDSDLSREVKEKRLLELFKDSEFDIEFTGEYTPFDESE
jgi:hypothetical protein